MVITKKSIVTLSDIFWLFIFLMISLPLHASNKILSYLSVTGMISWFHILIGLIFICKIITTTTLSLNGQKVYDIILGISLVVTIVIGFLDKSHNANNVIGDSSMYILSYMIFFLIVEKKVKAKTIDELFEFVFHAMTLNLLINCIMYFTREINFWGLTSFNGGRFGGGYYSLLIVSVTYGFYDFMSDKRISSHEFYIHLVMAVFCSILAQSRTHVILCFVGCVAVLFFRKGKLSTKYILRLGIVLLVATIGVILFLNSDNALVDRILSMDIGSETETTASRVYTWTYYWEKICEMPIGTGFGEIMYFINPSLTIAKATATYYVDNAFACVLYKGGFFYGILYFGCVFLTFLKLIREWKVTKANFYLMYAIIYAMLIFATAIFTSQIIHTYAVNTFAWIFAGCVLRDNTDKIKDNCFIKIQ